MIFIQDFIKLFVCMACVTARPQNTYLSGVSTNVAALFPIQMPFMQQPALTTGRVVSSVAQQSEYGYNGILVPSTQPNVIVAQPRVRTVQILTPATVRTAIQPAIKVIQSPTVYTQQVLQPAVVQQPIVAHHVVTQPVVQPQIITAAQPQIISQPVVTQPSTVVLPQGSCIDGVDCQSTLNYGVGFPSGSIGGSIVSARMTEKKNAKRSATFMKQPKETMAQPKHLKSDLERSKLDITF